MLPYQEDGKRLEQLLEKLFEDDGSTPEDVGILRKPGRPRPLSECCSYSYGSVD
jgi:hypothetical protein